MGQKVHPIGFRLGINKGWNSNWFAKREYQAFLHEDIIIRKYLKKRLYHASISKVSIERVGAKIKINIHTAKPGIIIGKKGMEVDRLKSDVEKRVSNRQVFINIMEVRRPEIDAQLVAENIALQLVRRVTFRKAMKRSVNTALKVGAQGIKVSCSGRLGGAEIARTEWYRDGRVPLHTIRADIDYGFSEALTTYGIIGVKVWIFNGDILTKRDDGKN